MIMYYIETIFENGIASFSNRDIVIWMVTFMQSEAPCLKCDERANLSKMEPGGRSQLLAFYILNTI